MTPSFAIASRRLLATIVLATSPIITAEEPADAWHLHQHDRAWLQPFDPTLLAPRLKTQWEHKDLGRGDSTDKIFVNMRETFRLADSLALALQMELPTNWKTRDEEHFSGLGDMEFRSGLVGRLAPDLRWALAVNTRFDTASESALSAGGFEWRPIGALRWDAARWLTLGLQPEYTFAADSRDDFLELKFPVAIELGSRLSAEVVYQPKWFVNQGGHRVDVFEGSLNWRFGAKKRYAVLAGAEVPISEGDFEWRVFAGLQWFYR